MLSSEMILKVLPDALDKLEVPGDLPRGRVRDFYVLQDGKRRVMISTDRLSVFDRVLGLVPFRGQILNQLSAWWFPQTADIIANHFIAMPDPNVTIARESRPILLEVIVRGYVTGVSPTSLWTRYASGEREIYGVKFPDGLTKNDPLPQPMVTATSKSTVGHDDRVIINDPVGDQHVQADTWKQITEIALALFNRGQEIAATSGLILVDSKYEFGIDEETHKLILIDELHTPDSSRYWEAATYLQRIEIGEEPENLDKELVRLWYRAQSNQGDDHAPALNDRLIVAVSQRYQRVFEAITGQPFQPADYPAQDRIQAALAQFV